MSANQTASAAHHPPRRAGQSRAPPRLSFARNQKVNLIFREMCHSQASEPLLSFAKKTALMKTAFQPPRALTHAKATPRTLPTTVQVAFILSPSAFGVWSRTDTSSISLFRILNTDSHNASPHTTFSPPFHAPHLPLTPFFFFFQPHT